MNPRAALLIGLAFVMSACGSHTGGISSNEPPGKAVELTQEDRDRARATYEDVKEWATWEMKGTHLLSTRNGKVVTPETYEQALYCFHKAQAAWPQELPDNATEDRKQNHRPEPTDTLIQKAFLYMKMNQPKLALEYFKRADSYIPYNTIIQKGMADAEAMLKRQG
jgi:tetratricopeptide (TPR) repeat protein